MPQNKIIYGPNRVPKASEFAIGEVIINVDDGKVYSKDKQNRVFDVTSGAIIVNDTPATGGSGFNEIFLSSLFESGTIDGSYVLDSGGDNKIFTVDDPIDGAFETGAIIKITSASISTFHEVTIVAPIPNYIEIDPQYNNGYLSGSGFITLMERNVARSLSIESGTDSAFVLSGSTGVKITTGSENNAIEISIDGTAIAPAADSIAGTLFTFGGASGQNAVGFSLGNIETGDTVTATVPGLGFNQDVDFNSVTLLQDLLANGNVFTEGYLSASGLLYASLSFDDTLIEYPYGGVVVYNTASGRFYYTGSYGGGGDSVLASSLTTDLSVSDNVGGVDDGDTFSAGTSLETILRDILIEYGQANITNFEVGYYDQGSTPNAVLGLQKYEPGNSSSLEINWLKFITSSDSLGGTFDETFHNFTFAGAQKDNGSAQSFSVTGYYPFGSGQTTASISEKHVNRTTAGKAIVQFTTIGRPSGEDIYSKNATIEQEFISPIFFGGSTSSINETNINSALLDTVLADISGSGLPGGTGTTNLNNVGYSNQSYIDNAATAFPDTVELVMPDSITGSGAYTYIIYPSSFNSLTEISKGNQNEFGSFVEMGTANHTRYNLSTTYRVYRSVGHRPFENNEIITIND